MSDGLKFVFEFLRSPLSVGALWPSSRSLARLIVELGAVRQAAAVVELGPGTGAFTSEILKALPAGGRFLAIERNPRLASTLAPKIVNWACGREASVVEGCATRLQQHLGAVGFPPPATVISGLPWASFDKPMQETLLAAIESALPPGGQFVTFAYYGPHLSPRGRAFREQLEQVFDRVERSPVVFNNLPPAFVYIASRGAE